MTSKDEALKMASTLRAIGGYPDLAMQKQVSCVEIAKMLENLALEQPAQEPVVNMSEILNEIADAIDSNSSEKLRHLAWRFENE